MIEECLPGGLGVNGFVGIEERIPNVKSPVVLSLVDLVCVFEKITLRFDLHYSDIRSVAFPF